MCYTERILEVRLWTVKRNSPHETRDGLRLAKIPSKPPAHHNIPQHGTCGIWPVQFGFKGTWPCVWHQMTASIALPDSFIGPAQATKPIGTLEKAEASPLPMPGMPRVMLLGEARDIVEEK